MITRTVLIFIVCYRFFIIFELILITRTGTFHLDLLSGHGHVPTGNNNVHPINFYNIPIVDVESWENTYPIPRYPVYHRKPYPETMNPSDRIIAQKISFVTENLLPESLLRSRNEAKFRLKMADRGHQNQPNLHPNRQKQKICALFVSAGRRFARFLEGKDRCVPHRYS